MNVCVNVRICGGVLCSGVIKCALNAYSKAHVILPYSQSQNTNTAAIVLIQGTSP